ncbi:MAG: SDR family oxidoreductase [Chloroflexota bacterium]|nr:MAG: SDR family oxidoreductase [Chloroflexota bacterium]
MLLKNKVAIVTGGAKGIGLGIAERFVEEGAKVVIGDIDVETGENAAGRLRAKGHDAIFATMDVTDEASIRGALDRCLDTFGRVDILVNNAGIELGAAVVDLERDIWEKVLEVNLTGPFLCSHVICPQMIKQGNGGSVIFIASQAGKRGEAYASAYCSSKFGSLGLMECLSGEMAEFNIRVNGICPGSVDTVLRHQSFEIEAQLKGINPEKYKKDYINNIPLRRMATPADIGDVCVFLSSPLASYITGESINVDGGELSG